ncbi:hypothetical protein J5X84_44295 [Streptosporangiaceae bacterium NEAU-GS5]|nr:hypothetical protein [Streptosporangiaceae bacterium NEAU-GS5]
MGAWDGVDDLGDDAMTALRAVWSRWLLRGLSVVLGVGVAVASNQILTEGAWSWWWTGIAVALTAVSAMITYWLTRPSAESPATADSGGSSGQVVDRSTVGTSIDQLRGITGHVRIRDASARVLPTAAPLDLVGFGEAFPAPGTSTDQTANQGGEGPKPLRKDGGQRVSGSQVGGSINQIDGVGGDVTIERS